MLTDERPGHTRLAEGMIAAVDRLRPVEVTRLRARRPRYAGGPLALAINVGLPPSLILSQVFGLPVDDLPTPDLVVSAGAETLAANVALARHVQRPNLFYGSLRSFRAADFRVVFTSYARQARAANQIVALKPQPHDPDRAQPLDLPWPEAGPTAALILGGPVRGCAWQDAEWTKLLDLTIASTAAPSLRWIIANSRRTPASVSDAALVRARQNSARVAFVDVRTSDASLAGVLAAADFAVVTADSSSMVSEAIWMRRPVLAATPAALRHRPDEAAYRAWLASEGWMIEADVAGLDAGRMVTIIRSLRAMTENPLDALSEILRTRLPELF
jgi:hypothetical protein